MLTKDKLDIIKCFNSDDSDLICKIIKYLETVYIYNRRDNVFKDFSEIYSFLDDKDDKEAITFGFTKQSLRDDIVCVTESDFKINKCEDSMYSGKDYDNKIANIGSCIKKYDKYFESKNKIRIIIDISSISRYPLWYTMMRRKMIGIIEILEKAKNEDLTEKFVHSVIINAKEQTFIKTEQYDIDLVINLIKHFNESKPIDVFFIDSEENPDSIFLINELNKFIYALSIDKTARCEYIYDTVCKDLDEMFAVYNFCNFKNDMCVAQRHKNLFMRYPTPKTDGCCFKVVRKCEHNNKDGTCKVKCLPCKLFTCPYLGKIKIGTRASENILLRSFFNNKQKKISIYKFFTKKEVLLEKIIAEENKK